MALGLPHVTISIARGSGGSDTSGDLNSLSVGFGVFQAWLFIAVFGATSVFGKSEYFASFPFLPTDSAALLLDAFSISLAVFLLLIAFSNQLLLKFYVGKNALVFATTLSLVGTFLIYGSHFDPMSGVLTAIAGVLMGAGASLMIALWGTAFSRYEFTTIALNSIAAVIIGIAVYVVLAHWVVAPLSGAIAGLLPVVAALLLWKQTPIPYYRRQEIPIFHPLPVHRTAFALRFGIPVLLFGIPLGLLRNVCLSGLLLATDVSSQLVIGAAAAAAAAVFIVTVVIARGRPQWDTAFRCIVPFAVAAIVSLSWLGGPGNLPASFFAICGCICLEALIWFLFSNISQEFRLSPIFVIGLGRGILEIGSIIGITLADSPHVAGMLDVGQGSLIMLVILAVAHALLPRENEIRSIVDASRVFTAPSLSALRAEIEAGSPSPLAAVAVVDSAESASSANVLPAASVAEGAQEEAAEDGHAPDVAREAVAEVDSRSRAKGRFHARCEEIADMYLLSRRETEVMFLLAKGHNAAFIQDKLCISKSTAKTHINHIYRKLDIHTQQELLNMVEERPSHDASAS